MHLLLKQLEMKKRLIVILGLPSVGKSSLARAVMHFVEQRDYFLAGVTLVQAKGLRDINVFKNMMMKNFFKDFEKNQEFKKQAEDPNVTTKVLFKQMFEMLKDKAS